MKKISLLKSLAILGAVTLTSVCVVETALLIHKNIGPENGDLINLNTYDSYTLAETLDYAPISEAEAIELIVNSGIKNGPTGPTIHPITDKEDIDVTVLTETQQILVFAKNNSASYVQGSHATISYGLQAKQTLDSIFGSDPIVAHMDDKYDDDFTKAYILNSLQSQYPALNINHLDVAITSYAQENEGSAIVSVKAGSNLYDGSNAAVTYYTSGSVSMTLDKYLIKPGDTATASFKFHNATPSTGLTYTMPVAAQTGTFTWTGNAAGTLVYNTNVADFAGGSYEIVGTYINGDKTYVSRCIVYAQSNLVKGELKVANPTINMTTKNSGTATYTVNGAAPSGGTAAYSITPAIPTGEGLSFATGTGILTWNGTTPTLGGQYRITCTYSGTSIKTSTADAYVEVKAQQDASLTVTNSYITTGVLNSGTLAFTINGQAYTTSATYTTAGIPSNQGISWDGTNRQIKWDGTTPTLGCVVTITASYTLNNQVIKAETKVTVAAQITAALTVTNSYVQTGALNSGTLAFTINGQAYTTSATYATVGIPANQGISWNGTNRQIVWDGTTATRGCVVTITASYTFNSQVIKAETKVTVAESYIVETMTTAYDSKWTVSAKPHKINRVAQLDYVTVQPASTIVYNTSYAFITDAKYKPTYDVALRGMYDTGSGWRDLGLIIFSHSGNLQFFGEVMPSTSTTFRLTGMWLVD